MSLTSSWLTCPVADCPGVLRWLLWHCCVHIKLTGAATDSVYRLCVFLPLLHLPCTMCLGVVSTLCSHCQIWLRVCLGFGGRSSRRLSNYHPFATSCRSLDATGMVGKCEHQSVVSHCSCGMPLDSNLVNSPPELTQNGSLCHNCECGSCPSLVVTGQPASNNYKPPLDPTLMLSNTSLVNGQDLGSYAWFV